MTNSALQAPPPKVPVFSVPDPKQGLFGSHALHVREMDIGLRRAGLCLRVAGKMGLMILSRERYRVSGEAGTNL